MVEAAIVLGFVAWAIASAVLAVVRLISRRRHEWKP